MQNKKFTDTSLQIPIDINDLYVGEMLIDITDNIVPGIYDYYMISNFGRVYHKYLGSFLKPGISGAGYYFVYLSTDTGQKMMQMHRLVMLSFIPIPDADLFQVNHKNGNKLDNCIINLEWCTRSENQIHSYKIGLHPKSSVIDDDTAKKICELLATNKYTNLEISNIVGNGATEGIVSDIKTKASWKDISKDYTFIQRPGKLFTDEVVNNICKYFSENDIGNLTVNDHCRNALQYYGYESSDNIVDSARKIYIRKYYTNISNNYDF